MISYLILSYAANLSTHTLINDLRIPMIINRPSLPLPERLRLSKSERRELEVPIPVDHFVLTTTVCDDPEIGNPFPTHHSHSRLY